ncbi:MAG TPA: response regulator, partial [Burkholderiaceae bacterium]|nr:response regulator [Burkholderiaceae bacterium]
LRLDGHAVHTAYDGPAALVAAREFQPEAVVLDLGLPGIDGLQVAQALRADPQTAQVTLIAASGYGQASDIERTTAAGFDHHLVKPVPLQALRDALAAGRTPR